MASRRQLHGKIGEKAPFSFLVLSLDRHFTKKKHPSIQTVGRCSGATHVIPAGDDIPVHQANSHVPVAPRTSTQTQRCQELMNWAGSEKKCTKTGTCQAADLPG